MEVTCSPPTMMAACGKRRDLLDQLHHHRPFVGKHDRDANDVSVLRDARGDVVEPQADQVALAVTGAGSGPLGNGVDHVDAETDGLQSGGNECQAQRRGDRSGGKSERLDARRPDQTNIRMAHA